VDLPIFKGAGGQLMGVPVDVLVVENPQHDPELTLVALHDQADGIKIAVVNNGAAAQRFLANCVILPKVMLLDMQLPDMDGIELLRRIRCYERMKSLPVLMLMEASDQWRKTEALRLGVNGYLPKTTDVQILADHLTIFRHLIAGDRSGIKGDRSGHS
jgi:CheY-like chemotaxis protein